MQTEIQKDSEKTVPALIAIQSELKAPKTRNNKFGGFSYRSAADILEAAKPLLRKYNCLTFLTDEIIQFGDTLILKSTAYFFDELGKGVTTNGFAIIDRTRKNMDAAQQTGSASSYARKTALCGLFLVDDAIDPDSLPAMPDQASAPAVPPMPPVPPAPSTVSTMSTVSTGVRVPPPPPGALRNHP